MTIFGKTYRLSAALAMIAAVSALSSCSLMHDDLNPCAVKPDTYTSVRFVYDYNTANKDLFAEQVGAVTLYVFDTNGYYLFDVERRNHSSLPGPSTPGFQIDFTTDQLVPGNSYTVYAVAHANPGGYDATMETPGFERITDMAEHHTAADFGLMLQRETGLVPHDNVMLDTLWTTLTPCVLDIPVEKIPEEGDLQEPDHIIQGVVPLMRVTNSLSICFWQADFPTKIDPSRFEVKIDFANGNGNLDITGNLNDDEPLTFHPYRTRVENRTSDNGAKACVIADFGLSRLMLGDDIVLTIRDNESGRETRLENVSKHLARGNEAFRAEGWTDQEYLDREYDYSLEFPFDGPVPKWVQVNVQVLGWSKRFQNENL